MSLYRITLIIDSKLEGEDEIYEDIFNKKVGRNSVLEVENVEICEDYEEDENVIEGDDSTAYPDSDE